MSAAALLALVVLALGLLLSLTKSVRDMLVVRHVRAMLTDCTPSERVRVCLHLASALHDAPPRVLEPAGPDGESRQASLQEVADE
ncbi:hypothetical protein [Streptomyces vietnamensis]|uniref:hypothetical protein n=1 Tax=Streptomyces vietnamensis TaxID=362257 RepID=UPI00343216AD